MRDIEKDFYVYRETHSFGPGVAGEQEWSMTRSGFRIRLNGYAISAVNGFGSYSENHFIHTLAPDEQGGVGTNTVEVAVMNDEGFIRLTDGDDVAGHVTPLEFAELLAYIGRGGDPTGFFIDREEE